MNPKSKFYIQKLELQKHPEGGYYREIYRSAEMITTEYPGRRKKRNYSTSIYFLLDGKQVSKFHKLRSDELWHFYDGSSVLIHIIDENGNYKKIIVGKNISSGDVYQTVIKKNCWFAAEVIDKKSFALVGCTVSPGFDFSDFEFGDRESLINKYPDLKSLIIQFT